MSGHGGQCHVGKRVMSGHRGICHVGKRVLSGHGESNVTSGKEYCQVMGGVMSRREKTTKTARG